MFSPGPNHLKTTLHGLIVGVELEEGTLIEPIMDRIVDALQWIEGTGEVEVDYLGEIEVIPLDPDANDIDAEVQSWESPDGPSTRKES